MDVNFFYVNELFFMINVLIKNDIFTLIHLKYIFILMADLKNNVKFEYSIS